MANPADSGYEGLFVLGCDVALEVEVVERDGQRGQDEVRIDVAEILRLG